MCDKDKRIKEIADYRSGKMDFVKQLEDSDLGITPQSLGITQEQLDDEKYWHDVDDDELNKFSTTKQDFRVLRLYKYVSRSYGPSEVGPNTRDFCRRVAARTNQSLMRFEDINKLNSSNPGFGSGGSSSYSVFRWRGGNNCKHIWKKFLFDTKSNNLVPAPAAIQPENPDIEPQE